MNTKLGTEAKNDFEKNLYKLMNNAVFGKTMENVRKYRDNKIVTTDKSRNQWVSEPNCHTTKYLSEDLLAIEIKKINVRMNKPVYLGFLILEISKTLMYEFWHDYIKPKYQDNAILCYMDTDSFIIYIKIEVFCKDVADDGGKCLDTSKYSEEDDRPLLRGIKKQAIGLFKDESGGKIMKEFVALRPEPHSDLMDDNIEYKKGRGTKRCVIKERLKFNDYKYCIFKNKTVVKLQQRFKSEAHIVYTEEINKIALGSNDVNWLKTFDRITTYLYGTNAFKVCKSDMIIDCKLLIR